MGQARGPASRRPRSFQRGGRSSLGRTTYRQGPTLKVLAVELLDRPVGFLGGGEFEEGEATGLAGRLVQHQVDGRDHAGLGEVTLQVIFPGVKREVANE